MVLVGRTWNGSVRAGLSSWVVKGRKHLKISTLTVFVNQTCSISGYFNILQKMNLIRLSVKVFPSCWLIIASPDLDTNNKPIR